MNANPKFLAATAHVDDAAVQPLPNSRKVYVTGSPARHPRADARDRPGRHAGCHRRREEPAGLRLRHLRPLHRSGAKIDIRAGLAPLRAKLDRGARRHRRRCPGLTSDFGRERAADPDLPKCASTCSARRAAPSRAGTSRRCTTRARASSRRRWNTSRSARTCSAGVSRKPERAVRRDKLAEMMAASIRARPSARPSRRRSRRNSCATKSRAAAPSSRPTSTTRKPSR